MLFAGQNIGEEYTAELLDALKNRSFAVVMISKSGTTTEPAIAFRFLKKELEDRHGKEEAAKRIFAVTDKSRGALKQLADREGYTQFVIPDDVGGRFSVLTPVGLLPIAAAGYDIRAMVEGARAMEKLTAENSSLDGNPAMLYAAARNAPVPKGFQNRNTGQLLPQPALHHRMVETALRGKRGQRRQRDLPRRRGSHFGSPLHGSADPGWRTDSF